MAKQETKDGKYFSGYKWADVNKENKKIMETFLSGKMSLSPATLRQYRNALQIFFLWVLEEADNKPIHELRKIDFLMYQNWLLSEGLSAGSIKFRRSAVSSLCKFIIVYYGDIEPYSNFRNLVDGVEAPKGNKVHKKVPLTKGELNKLRRYLSRNKKWQQLAYLEMSYSTGGRREEIRQIKKSVVDAEFIEISNGKGYYKTNVVRAKGRGKEGERRKLKFSQEAMDAAKKWVEERKKLVALGQDESEYLFVSTSAKNGTKQVAKSTFNSWCTEIFSKVLERRVHPHLLRSTRATHIVVDEGKSIEGAKSLLGHKDISTTQIYVVRDEEEDVEECFL